MEHDKDIRESQSQPINSTFHLSLDSLMVRYEHKSSLTNAVYNNKKPALN